MPNTLVHIAAQGALTKAAVPRAPLHLVYAGCLIPDIPWILQRATRTLLPGIDPYDLRAYAVAQTSLAMSLLLCASIALMTLRPLQSFSVLASGSLLHLLLDACEIKWANGVTLLAPFDWRLVQFNWIWPEHWIITVLTLCGAVFFVALLPRALAEPLAWTRTPRRWMAAVAGVAAYFALPVLGINAATAADNHFVQILASPHRTGRYVEFDRVPCVPDAGGGRIRTFAGERLQLSGADVEGNATVSIRGRFVDEQTVAVLAMHVHTPAARDVASCIGILMIVGLWGAKLAGWKSRDEKHPTSREQPGMCDWRFAIDAGIGGPAVRSAAVLSRST